METPSTSASSSASSLPPTSGLKRPWTILGRLAKAIREQNWFAVVLELAIVVLGVVIGFQVTAWGQSRADWEVETKSLREIRTALLNDIADIRINLWGHRRGAASARILREHLREQRPYHDSLDAHFGRVLASTVSLRDETAYETLKQRGLDTVTNDSLRTLIGTVYGVDYPTVIVVQQWRDDMVFRDAMRFYRTHFRDARPWQSATPVDYAALLSSTEYGVFLDWFVFMHVTHSGSLEKLESNVLALIALLEEELETR